MLMAVSINTLFSLEEGLSVLVKGVIVLTVELDKLFVVYCLTRIG